MRLGDSVPSRILSRCHRRAGKKQPPGADPDLGSRFAVSGDQTAICSDGHLGSTTRLPSIALLSSRRHSRRSSDTAALSGIDVKVMVSAKPSGNRLPDWAGHTYIE